MEGKKQYLLKIQFAMDEEENKWWIGAVIDPQTKAGQRFYDSLDQAKKGLARLLRKFNQEFKYDPDGKRMETIDAGGVFTADLVLDKSLDDMNRIIKWSIQERYVTPWEKIESGNID